ncbi:MAG TPA: DSD1 family PLP-dependent enzyme [Chloroflexota bacterium]|jgi:D-serine deaminase-like pyridoxal phosphate-dependent protein|nr:DSD1 family PLP-dependent enzyme [Chloroflexota bacterium]
MVWSPESVAPGTRIQDLDTPCLLLDLDKVERNLDLMAAAFEGTHVKLRPHAKTHKSPRLALMQLERGAIGVCCAKLGEAEVMAAGGVTDLLVTSPLVGTAKIRRLLALARQADVTTVVDDAGCAARISDAAQEAGLRIKCLVDLDLGTHRTGVEPGEPALRLATAVSRLPGLQFLGLQGYEGHAQHIVGIDERRAVHARAAQLLTGTADLLREKGLPVEIVSTAGTGTCRFTLDWQAVTDVQPGSYVVMDTDYGRVDGLGFEHALTVLANVVSKRGNVAILDAGLKTLSTDAGPAAPRDLEAEYAPFGDEHGRLTFKDGNPLAHGDKVHLLPRHCDPTINLHDVYHVTRGDTVVGVWPIAARGCIQ